MISMRVGKLPSGAFALSVARVVDVRLVIDIDGEHSLIARPEDQVGEENR